MKMTRNDMILLYIALSQRKAGNIVYVLCTAIVLNYIWSGETVPREDLREVSK